MDRHGGVGRGYGWCWVCLLMGWVCLPWVVLGLLLLFFLFLVMVGLMSVGVVGFVIDGGGFNGC